MATSDSPRSRGPGPRDPKGSVVGDRANDRHAVAWTLQWVADRLASEALRSPPGAHDDVPTACQAAHSPDLLLVDLACTAAP
jgi:hypothetical protein